MGYGLTWTNPNPNPVPGPYQPNMAGLTPIQKQIEQGGLQPLNEGGALIPPGSFTYKEMIDQFGFKPEAAKTFGGVPFHWDPNSSTYIKDSSSPSNQVPSGALVTPSGSSGAGSRGPSLSTPPTPANYNQPFQGPGTYINNNGTQSFIPLGGSAPRSTSPAAPNTASPESSSTGNDWWSNYLNRINYGFNFNYPGAGNPNFFNPSMEGP